MFKILTVNLGATSTKLSFFEDENLIDELNRAHSEKEMNDHPLHKDQLEMRVQCAEEWLSELGISTEDISAAVVRVAGLKRCSKSGVYEIGPELEADIEKNLDLNSNVGHISLLGYHLLRSLADVSKFPVYIVDSPWTDEFTEVARMTGLPNIKRKCVFHALNSKAIARKTAAKLRKDYWNSSIIVAHMGGGTSVAAHVNGRTVDACVAGGDQDGPFSATRTGMLPAYALIEMCMSGKFSENEMKNLIMSKGGFYALTGETDLRVIEKRAAEGDSVAEAAIQAFIYQMSKGIGTMCGVIGLDKVDAIALTGGMAFSERVVSGIKEKLGKFALVFVFPGEKEAESMAAGALRALRKEEPVMYL